METPELKQKALTYVSRMNMANEQMGMNEGVPLQAGMLAMMMITETWMEHGATEEEKAQVLEALKEAKEEYNRKNMGAELRAMREQRA